EAHLAILEEIREQLLDPAGGGPGPLPAGWRALLPELAKMIASRAIGTDCGTIAYNAYQFFGGMAYTAQDLIGKYSRDAAEFMFLLLPDTELDRRIGTQVLEQAGALRALLEESWLVAAARPGVLGPEAAEYRADLGRGGDALAYPSAGRDPEAAARAARRHWRRRAA